MTEDSKIHQAVEQANSAFYRAFRERNYEAMEQIWAKHVPIACIHPGMAPLIGRSEVLRSWRGILKHPESPLLEATMVRVHLLGTSAMLTCLEGTSGELPRLVATNVFTFEEGRWRLVHHHGAALLHPKPRPSTSPKDKSQLN